MDVQKLMAIVNPKKHFVQPKRSKKFRRAVYDFVMSRTFEEFIMGIIMLNILQMALGRYVRPIARAPAGLCCCCRCCA